MDMTFSLRPHHQSVPLKTPKRFREQGEYMYINDINDNNSIRADMA